MTKKSFFDEIVENPTEKIEKHAFYFTFLLGVILLWVFVAVPEQAKNVEIYVFMLIVWGFAFTFDLIWQRLRVPNQMAANGLGKKPAIAFLIGAVSIIGINAIQPQLIITPLSIVSPGILSFLFIVVAAPIVEANFFRGLLQPIMVMMFKELGKISTTTAGILATLVQSTAFAFFHINIFGATGSWVPYFVFGVIATLGVYAMKSIAFEFGLHSVNNYFAWLVMPK